MIILTLLIIISGRAYGQRIENEFQLRTSVDFSKKITKGLWFELTPELRWGSGEVLDKYLLTGGLRYKPLKLLSLSAQYRVIGNMRVEKSTEYLGRYLFKAKLSDKIHRWEPGFRLAYTNYTDENEDGKYLRYRVSLGYDITKCKLTPETGFEVYQDLNQHNIYKYRSKIGLDYKISGRLSFSASYKFDYYMTRGKNRHIINTGLKVKF